MGFARDKYYGNYDIFCVELFRLRSKNHKSEIEKEILLLEINFHLLVIAFYPVKIVFNKLIVWRIAMHFTKIVEYKPKINVEKAFLFSRSIPTVENPIL